jgi:NADH-quinone oxidoreductase subunit G
MVEVEIDGKKVEVAEGSMVISAATSAGVYVPHFCYHKKLSIAANCRMCLVEVEKAPKPLPACATPVAQGMKIHTKSEKAITAQKGVMEFLLINHPLDCPICDQGGECQLQDLAVGYGGSSSQYDQAKRVVFHKPMGPLISAQEMSRCIHCTRCVRFGQEVAGVMELGMAGRGEHSEIMSFVGRSVESELSGNMIDVCPVGALTSKPFRYSARSWELSRRRAVAAHDSLGSNITVQVKANKVMRVLPFENDAINECWISDRDRFAYEGLNSSERLTEPMIKQDGQWQKVDWQTALEYAAETLSSIKLDAGADQVGFLASGNSSFEELNLLGQVARAYGSDNVDFRLRQSDFRADSARLGIPWLGMTIAQLIQCDRVLAVGATLRSDHPLLTARLRQASKRQLKLSSIHAVTQDLLMPVVAQVSVAPSQWVVVLRQVLQAFEGELASSDSSHDDAVRSIANSLKSGQNVAILLGNSAVSHPDYSQLLLLTQQIAAACGGQVGVLGDSANSVGGYVAKAVPQTALGKNAHQQLGQGLRAYVLINVEPSQDVANPVAAMAALQGAQSVIALTAYASADLLDVADCLLPITPYTESAGTYINAEGRVQSHQAVVKPLGQARPAWKVLRVIGNLLGFKEFSAESAEQVRVTALSASTEQTEQGEVFVTGLNNLLNTALNPLNFEQNGSNAMQTVMTAEGKRLERLALIPQYRTDPILRRAQSLQQTRSSLSCAAAMSASTLTRLGLTAGAPVVITQGESKAHLIAEIDNSVAENTVRIDSARTETASLGAMYGTVTLQAVGVAASAITGAA